MAIKGKRNNANSSNGKNKGRGMKKNGKAMNKGKKKFTKKKPATAEDLDKEMDKYWGKNAEIATKMLDGDMDDYWKAKDENKQDNTTGSTETAPVIAAN